MDEAKRRNISCGVNLDKKSSVSNKTTLIRKKLNTSKARCEADLKGCTDYDLCMTATFKVASMPKNWKLGSYKKFVDEAKRRNISCGVKSASNDQVKADEKARLALEAEKKRKADKKARLALDAKKARLALDAKKARLALEAKKARLALEAEKKRKADEADKNTVDLIYSLKSIEIWGTGRCKMYFEVTNNTKFNITKINKKISVFDTDGDIISIEPLIGYLKKERTASLGRFWIIVYRDCSEIKEMNLEQISHLEIDGKFANKREYVSFIKSEALNSSIPEINVHPSSNKKAALIEAEENRKSEKKRKADEKAKLALEAKKRIIRRLPLSCDEQNLNMAHTVYNHQFSYSKKSTADQMLRCTGDYGIQTVFMLGSTSNTRPIIQKSGRWMIFLDRGVPSTHVVCYDTVGVRSPWKVYNNPNLEIKELCR